ncbi:hypothetical protein L7F22_012448, partial [Adiantum nelumboides]|nr:hypothetical protein [Adiantum nelumboides]
RFTPPLCLWAPIYPAYQTAMMLFWPLQMACSSSLSRHGEAPPLSFAWLESGMPRSTLIPCTGPPTMLSLYRLPRHAGSTSLTTEISSFKMMITRPHGDNQAAWCTHTAGIPNISNLTLLDSGNLVLHTKEGFIAWQSFAQGLAFALYSGMNLTSDMTIFSAALVPGGDSNFNAHGSYAMQLFNHSELVLFTNTNESFVYWSKSVFDDPLQASTDQISYHTSRSPENCRLLCVRSCACRVALFNADTSSCSLFSSLSTVPSEVDAKQLMLLKLPMETRSSKKYLVVIVGSICAVILVFLCTTCAIVVVHRSNQRKQREKSKGSPNEEVFLQELPKLPPKYTYKELEEATRGFST